MLYLYNNKTSEIYCSDQTYPIYFIPENKLNLLKYEIKKLHSLAGSNYT